MGIHEANPVAVVTGASSGIGAATARALVDQKDARVVLVARREERLRELASELGARASFVAVDLTDSEAPASVRRHVEQTHGRVDLLVNNAGASWRGPFAEEGFENVRRTMELNFEAVLRLTEAMLPLLQGSAPSSIVNVASTGGRIARAGAGGYSASKFALIGWSDALHLEERARGVHVGLVLPGFVATEGFPATELISRRVTRWIVSQPEQVARAIIDVGFEARAERYVPRPYAFAALARVAFPGLVRRAMGGRSAATMTTATAPGEGTKPAADG